MELKERDLCDVGCVWIGFLGLKEKRRGEEGGWRCGQSS